MKKLSLFIVSFAIPLSMTCDNTFFVSRNDISYHSHTFYGENDFERLKRLISHHGIEHPDIVLAQSILETGWFRSNVYIKLNNAFGMNVAKNRKTTAINSSGMAEYEDVEDSVVDYFLWQERYASGLTREQYLEILSQAYSEDDMYVCKIKSILRRIEKEETAPCEVGVRQKSIME